MTEGEAAESFSLSKRERAREREMERETGRRLVVGRGKSAKREERERALFSRSDDELCAETRRRWSSSLSSLNQ